MTDPVDTVPANGLRRSLFLCLALMAVGAVLLLVIFATEPTAEQETAVRQSAMPVDVIAPETGTFRPVIEALGSVRAAQDLELRSRVSGEVIQLSEQLVPGGFVRAGEVLLRVDDADYRNQLLQRESDLLQAQAALELEQGRQAQAEREYRELQRGRDRDLAPDSKSLVLRQPQLRSAQAQVKAAEAAVAQAALDLERTVVRAPFDAQVLSRETNLGALVSPGEALAELVGLDHYWVEATVPLDQLRWLDFAADGEAEGSPVAIQHRAAWPVNETRQGVLEQLVGELEGATRLARLLITVDDPLARAPAHAGQPSLIIGAFVESRIEGREISGTMKLPRATVRAGDTLWLMRDGALAIVPIEVVFEDQTHAYVRGDLSATDRVITTNIATVRDGIRLRLRSADGAVGTVSTVAGP